MCNYLHTITWHLEKVLVCVKKQKDLETRIDHAPAYVYIVQKEARLLRISIKDHNIHIETGT